MEEGDKMKGRVCVTGGTGFVASWLIKRLLENGYSVNTTVRPHSPGAIPGRKKDVSYLTSLPHAQERLHILTADLNNPASFAPALEGCVGLFLVAHPMDFQENESEDTVTNRSMTATLGILQACVDSKTVKRVVYTSSIATVMLNPGRVEFDEGSWTDVDFVRNENLFRAPYIISKTITERAVLEFAEKNSLDLVTVIPSWIHGPFLCPRMPGSVKSSLALIIGNDNEFKYMANTPFVHTDDIVRAHMFLFEHAEAKGRYICSATESPVDKLTELLATRYPQYPLLDAESLSDSGTIFTRLSSKKLLDTGFRFKYGLEEMFDDAIESCRQKGFL